MNEFFTYLHYAIYTKRFHLLPEHMELLREEWEHWAVGHLKPMSYEQFEKKIYEIADNYNLKIKKL